MMKLVVFRLFAAALGAIVICPRPCRWPKNGLKPGVSDGYNDLQVGQPTGGAICVGFGVFSTERVVPEELRRNFWESNLGVFSGK